MITQPDGAEVVTTHADAVNLDLPPLLVIEPLRDYFDAQGLGAGELSWERIGEGQANLTYRIRRGEESFVLRRGPRPPHPPSTHDMVRESRIQILVGAAGIPVPRILSVCDDESVLGVPFYVMDFLDGVVITNEIPAPLDAPNERKATVFAAVDALLDLHALDVETGELATIGRPHGYLERQVRRFSALWEQSTERSIPAVTSIGSWLETNLPASQRASIVHGDYRLGNLMFEPTAPARVAAILDWEMSTLGDPLADLGYFTATYSVPENTTSSPIELTPVTREHGYPSREDIIARYGAETSLDLSGLAWYQALALWKAAIFCEAIYTRWLHGERPGDDFAPTLEEGIPAMLDQAAAFIDNA